MSNSLRSRKNILRLRQSEPLKRRSLMWARIIKYGAVNFLRNGWLSLAAIVVMSFTLLTVFIATAATIVLDDTVEQTKVEKLDLSLYLRPDTPQEIQDELKATLEKDPNVSYVSVSSRQEVAESLDALDEQTRKLIEEDGQDIEAIFPVHFGIHVYDIATTDDLKEIVNGENSKFAAYLAADAFENQFFNENSQATVENMANIANAAQMVGFILAGIFLLITTLVIFNTIRLAIFARRNEIEIEKLIGAERYYVRGPFIVEADIYGIISGVIALVVGYAIILGMVPAVITSETVGGISTAMLHKVLINFAPLVVIGVILLGMLIGHISARFAVRKYLHY